MIEDTLSPEFYKYWNEHIMDVGNAGYYKFECSSVDINTLIVKILPCEQNHRLIEILQNAYRKKKEAEMWLLEAKDFVRQTPCLEK